MRVKGQRNGRRGFTLMELLTVMVIMGILLTAGIISYVGARRGAEMRGAIGAVRTTLSMARQQAVTRRRTTAVLFRMEGPEAASTNCLYVFEFAGRAAEDSANSLKSTPAPFPPPDYWPAEGSYVCNFDESNGAGRVAKLAGAGTYERISTPWVETGSGWKAGDRYGFQVGEKVYIPPGIRIKARGVDNAKIDFFTNGKSAGMAPVTIEFTDKLGGVASKSLTVYPLLGLMQVE